VGAEFHADRWTDGITGLIKFIVVFGLKMRRIKKGKKDY
jgi:hypothetical protein